MALGFPHKLHGEEIGAYVETEALDDVLRGKLEAAVTAMPLETRPKVILYGAAPIPRSWMSVATSKAISALEPLRTNRAITTGSGSLSTQATSA